VIHRVEPEYPKIAQQTGAKGEVEMSVTVGPDGSVTAVKVLRGHPMLQSAAVAAVKQWLFTPQLTETTTAVTLYFAGAEPGPQTGGLIQQAVLISRKDPVYPDAARQAGARGVVVVSATIGTDGHVTAAQILRGDPLLAQAAEDAVRQWIYKPTMLNGTPVETKTQITLNFVGGPGTPGLEGPQLLERTEPVHPDGELTHLAGTVMFRAKVGTDGRLGDIRVIDGPAELVPAALTAVKQWVYRPAKLNGQPVETFTEIALHFTPGR
jgi:TonB family protein